MRKKSNAFILVLSLAIALTSASDAQQARPLSEQLRHASLMPGGAMLYIQSGDLNALMRRWIASPVRAAYYKSPSFKAFSKSHVYLKLEQRKKDFESALGFGLDESRLAELAGGPSAVALYDIGKIELVFVTEVSRAKAAATAAFQQAMKFEERSASGTSYYVRELTTDGGRMTQQFCFVYAGGKLIITTAEGLMLRTLANLKSQTEDSLGPAVIRAAESAEGFAAHDVTMWLDQTKLNNSRLFRNYWIHRNPGELAAVENGLVDLRISAAGLTEQRWFKLKAGISQPPEVTGSDLAALLQFAPPDAQLIEVRGPSSQEDLANHTALVLYGEVPAVTAKPADGSRGHSRSSSSESANTGRYAVLDSRFDLDVDDPDLRGRSAETGVQPQSYSSDFVKNVAGVLSSAGAQSYCAVSRSRMERGKPFVGFERALVIALKADAGIDRDRLERLIVDELRARFVVTGSQTQFGWEAAGEVRFVAQSLTERGAAYAMSGRHLVLASSREFAADILRAAAGNRGTSPGASSPSSFAYSLVRIADARPMYDTLTSKLDRPTAKPVSSDSDGDEPERSVSLFSENISSLIAALNFRQAEYRRSSSGGQLLERVSYSW
jgi:hypothetical protein